MWPRQKAFPLLLIRAHAPHRESLARAENALSVSVSGSDGDRESALAR
jgi:hypothetical protein